MDESVEQRWIEGDPLKPEVMRKAPEQMVHEHVSQGEGVRGPKEKKRVPGWSAEEMKEKPNIDMVWKAALIFCIRSRSPQRGEEEHRS